ncbi:hypothetical protein QW71_21070 [Paenibacillus sp. IHB B 3415]|nr:hypothetical protein QW71_21070 [Paenibacillus sp. IHB B 3415]
MLEGKELIRLTAPRFFLRDTADRGQRDFCGCEKVQNHVDFNVSYMRGLDRRAGSLYESKLNWIKLN